MATIDSKEMIDKIIAANGALYEDDPPVIKIVEYTNAWGKVTWGVVFANEHPAMRYRYEIPTSYIQNPRVIWQRGLA